ncbi:MAG TPA: PEP-CTERM sorting domain-containing protein [Pyrinomonadaceae bacterium]|nr:PEP-CTERM sorting domain-containing protein [Pyrinomonadaceae bacterium]
MAKIFSAVCTLLLFAAFTPCTTHADPLVITNGFVTITGFVAGPAYSFAGNNFAVIGGAGDQGNSTPQAACFPCPSGAVINVNGQFVGLSLGQGSATFNGVVFPNVAFMGTFIFNGPPLIVPFSQSDVILTSPFTFGGHLVGCPLSCGLNPPVFSVDLVGSGVATLQLRFDGLDQGRPLFSFQSVRYDFEVPEPASILLLSAGLTALGARLRRRS